MLRLLGGMVLSHTCGVVTLLKNVLRLPPCMSLHVERFFNSFFIPRTILFGYSKIPSTKANSKKLVRTRLNNCSEYYFTRRSLNYLSYFNIYLPVYHIHALFYNYHSPIRQIPYPLLFFFTFLNYFNLYLLTW